MHLCPSFFGDWQVVNGDGYGTLMTTPMMPPGVPSIAKARASSSSSLFSNQDRRSPGSGRAAGGSSARPQVTREPSRRDSRQRPPIDHRKQEQEDRQRPQVWFYYAVAGGLDQLFVVARGGCCLTTFRPLALGAFERFLLWVMESVRVWRCLVTSPAIFNVLGLLALFGSGNSHKGATIFRSSPYLVEANEPDSGIKHECFLETFGG